MVSLWSAYRVNAHKFGLAESDRKEDDADDADDWGWDDCHIWEQLVWPDLALVPPPECDGVATRALFHRQLKSCGASTWLDPRPTMPRDAVHVRLFFWATDAGPDQAASAHAVLPSFFSRFSRDA